MDERKSGNFSNLFESTRSINEERSFKLGDKVKLSEAQIQFSSSVILEEGFSPAQATWLETLKLCEGVTGEIISISPGNGKVSVLFEGGHEISISEENLVLAEAEGGSWTVEYFPETGDQLKVVKGFKSQGEADAWLDAENLVGAEDVRVYNELEEAKKDKKDDSDCSCGADCACEEGVSGRKHRKRMRKRVREGEEDAKFIVMLHGKEEGQVPADQDERGGYLMVDFNEFKNQGIPDSDQLYLEDAKGYRYKRVMSPLPEDNTVLFKQI